MASRKISIIVPAYNEAKTIEKNILFLHQTIASIFEDFEIIIAEDGSSDETHPICKQLESSSSIVVLHNSERLGKGKAIKNACKAAKGDYIVFLDADLPVNLDGLPGLVSPLCEDYSLVVGSRYVEGAIFKRNNISTLKSRLYNILIKLVLNTNISDHQCGFKAMNKAHLESILFEVKDDHFFFDTELIAKTRKAGLKILEVPVEWIEPEGRVSHVTLLDEFIILFQLLKFLIRNSNSS